jgi:hypothetical protein
MAHNVECFAGGAYGVFSSHFFFLIRQVQQPCLLRNMLLGIVRWDSRSRDFAGTCKTSLGLSISRAAMWLMLRDAPEIIELEQSGLGYDKSLS